MPAAAAIVGAAAASRPIHSSFQSSQSRVSELRNAFVVTLHGPRLLQLRLALCGHGDVFFFSFHIVIQMGLMLDSNSAAAKGQLISKRLLVSSILPKKNEKIRLYYYSTSSGIVFVRFWGELKTLKRHFEINWLLVVT